MIMGFGYEYTYQDHEYLIRTMNNKHAQSPGTCICTFSLRGYADIGG